MAVDAGERLASHRAAAASDRILSNLISSHRDLRHSLPPAAMPSFSSLLFSPPHFFSHSLPLPRIALLSVMFEIISLFPLFPGSNELDQVEKIHLILGTPGPEMLDQLRQHSSHIKNFNFPPKAGSGIQRLVPHASPEAVDLMEKLLAYNPEHRLTARQALRHPYFRELREAEKRERDRVRTASPKVGRALQSRDANAAAANAAAAVGGGGGAGNGEDEKDDAASASSAVAAAAAAAGGGASSSGKDVAAGKKKTLGGKGGSNDGMVPSKKFPSIMPAQTNPAGMPASNHPFQQQHHGGGAGASGLTLPSAFDKGAHGAHSSSATSSPSLPAAAAGAGSIAMPHIHAGHHASHGHVLGRQIAIQPNLGGTADSLPSTDGSPSHAGGRRQPKGSKAHKAAAALHAQLLLEKQTAAAAAAAAAAADHAGDDMSEAGLDGSVTGDGVDGNADDGDEAAMRDRVALKHKEKAKELSLLKQTAAAAALAGSTAGATAASASHTRKTLHKNSSQLHLLASQQPHAYQQYSAAAVGGAHKQGAKTGKHAPVPSALLPSLAGGGRASAAGYDAAVAALHAAHASRASAAPAPAHGHAHGHGHGHGHAHGAATLAHLKSSSSLAMLQQDQGQGQWHGASNGPSPSNDDYADAYDDDQPNDSNAASALDMLQQQAALLHKKKQAAAAIGSASRKPKKGSAAATAAAYGQSPAAGSPHGTADNLSLSGHTAPISMHNSGSSTQLRSGKSSGKKSKAAAAALSMALHALDVAPQPHDGKQRK